jgi:carboxypeptidase Taq
MSTPSQTTPTYSALAEHHRKLHHYQHLASIASWDQAANMPSKGNAARSAALAELAALMHRMRTDATLEARIARAEQEPLDDMQRANLREIRRDWHLANALPEDLVQRRKLATSACEHAWRTQRPANDWAGFLNNLKPLLAIVREEAALLSQQTGLSKYDTMLDRYEPGMTTATLDRVFGDLRQWLPGLIQRVVDKQARETVLRPQGTFAMAQQEALCKKVVGLLGFDFEAGRMDTSTHPFCGGVPEDVRMTTRYREDDFLPALMGTVHETGHGRYEQNRPREWLGQPVSESRSMGIHESQSLSFEMQLGGHPGFAKVLAPLLREAFGDQPAFEPGHLHRSITRVQRGLIRVDADEVTYPAHIILRYEIERALIEGDIEAEDIPALWDAKMQELLGLDTRGNFKDGPMQDVHWPEALFGYFPCYSLGAMYAAQWFAAMRRAMPDLDTRIEAGDFAVVFDWLRHNIWSQASRWSTDELALRASGETLNPAHYRAHLEKRYLS